MGERRDADSISVTTWAAPSLMDQTVSKKWYGRVILSDVRNLGISGISNFPPAKAGSSSANKNCGLLGKTPE
jgi:hypothetical protein